MNTSSARRAGLAGLALLLSGSALAGTAYAAGSPSAAGREGRSAAPSVATAATPSTSQERARLEQQRGIVLEGTADLDGLPVMISLYENSAYGNSLQVVVGDPEAEGDIGYVEQAEPFVTDGVLDATVTVGGDALVLHGTVTRTGRLERLTEPVQDNGEQLVTKGTHQTLTVDATVGYAGKSGQVTPDTAFAYDLEVRRVTLYGGDR